MIYKFLPLILFITFHQITTTNFLKTIEHDKEISVYSGKHVKIGSSEEGFLVTSSVVMDETYNEVGLLIIKINLNGTIDWNVLITEPYILGYEIHGRNFWEMADGSYVFCGNKWVDDGTYYGRFAAFIGKMGRQGNVSWVKCIENGNTDEYSNAMSVIEISDGSGFILVGYEYTYTSGQNANVMIVKLDTNGDVVWYKTMGGSSTDVANNVIETVNGSFVIIGYSGSSGSRDIIVIKLKSNGDKIWDRTYGSLSSGMGEQIIETTDYGYFLFGVYGYSSILIKLSQIGNVEYTKVFNYPYQVDITSFSQTSDGYIFIGYSNVYLYSKYDIVKSIGGENFDRGKAVFEVSDGDYLFIADTQSLGNVPGYNILIGKIPSYNIPKLGNDHTLCYVYSHYLEMDNISPTVLVWGQNPIDCVNEKSVEVVNLTYTSFSTSENESPFSYCFCEDGWNTQNCENFECNDSPCDNIHANCTAPNYCNCMEGWTDRPACLTEVCDPPCPYGLECINRNCVCNPPCDYSSEFCDTGICVCAVGMDPCEEDFYCEDGECVSSEEGTDNGKSSTEVFWVIFAIIGGIVVVSIIIVLFIVLLVLGLIRYFKYKQTKHFQELELIKEKQKEKSDESSGEDDFKDFKEQTLNSDSKTRTQIDGYGYEVPDVDVKHQKIEERKKDWM